MMRQRMWVVVALMMSSAVAEDRQTTLKIGDKAPRFDFRLIEDGSRPDLADFDGEYLFLDFWATWCPPCIKSIPHLNELQAKFEGRPARFFSITYEPAGMVKPFIEKHGLKLPVGLDNDFAMFKAYKAWGIPTMYVIDPKGQIVSVTSPFHVTSEVVEAVLEGKIPQVDQYKGWQDPAGAEEYFRSLVEKWRAQN